jgi:hypothetical protein
MGMFLQSDPAREEGQGKLFNAKTARTAKGKEAVPENLTPRRHDAKGKQMLSRRTCDAQGTSCSLPQSAFEAGWLRRLE